MITMLVATAGLMCGILAQPADASPNAKPPASPTHEAKDPTPPAPPAPKDGAEVVKQLVAEAALLTPLVESGVAREFLAAAGDLPVVESRTVYRKPGSAITAATWETLSEEERATYRPRVCTPEFYYYTGYGSPLVYSRVVDLMGLHGVPSLDGKRVLDFGYGTIGHLRLMSQRGAEVHGVEIEPLFEALYSNETDVRVGTGPQTVFLHTGQWPAYQELTKHIASHGRDGTFDVVTSKNTLKRGYVHPEPPAGKTVDERMLVKLGVDDETFLAAVHAALKPGGLFIIYNICPAQSPSDDPTKPYLPMADGRSPFTREQYAAAGFEVITFDGDDQTWVLGCWKALEYDEGKPKEEAAKETYAHYTVVRKK
ncbi:MAG: hypothetical protein IPK69_09295 [Phycisphaerales bacterium]|nr:MAG: hypothetical protein IPK69_09295 [Phycisphaerales bacterium]